MIAGGGVDARLIAFPSLLGSTYRIPSTHRAVEIKSGDPQWMRCFHPWAQPTCGFPFPGATGADGAVGDNASRVSRREQCSAMGVAKRCTLSRDA